MSSNRPTFTTEELKTFWPRLHPGAQKFYLDLRKRAPYAAERYLRVQFDHMKPRSKPIELTDYEKEILECLDQTLPSNEIAAKTGIANSRVHYFLDRLQHKDLVQKVGKHTIAGSDGKVRLRFLYAKKQPCYQTSP